MAEENLTDDQFSFDQPWNPISYFEEEQEAAGTEESHYSPNHLASLFDPIDTNVCAVNDDLERSKHLHHTIEDPYFNRFVDPTENGDIDNFTLDTESGMKVLDTTIAINRKAIYNDFDRLRKWQQNTETNDNKDEMFIDKSKDLFTSIESKASGIDKHENDNTNINLLLDPFASIVDDDNKYESPRGVEGECSEDRMNQLVQHMNESSCTLLGDISNLNSPVNELDVSAKQVDFLFDGCGVGSKDQQSVVPNQSKTSEEEEDFSLLDDLLDDSQENTQTLVTDENKVTNIPDDLFELPASTSNGLNEEDSVEALINSSDTSDIDKIVELVSNIHVIPPTPESAISQDLINNFDLKTWTDNDHKEEEMDSKNNTLSDVGTEDKDFENEEDELYDPDNLPVSNLDDEENASLPPPPAYHDSIDNAINENATEIMMDCVDNETLIVNSTSENEPKNIEHIRLNLNDSEKTEASLVDVNQDSDIEVIVNKEETLPLKEPGNIENMVTENSDMVSTEKVDSIEKTEFKEDSKASDPIPKACTQVNISSVSDEYDSLKCLTPDGDSDSNDNEGEDSDPQDIETFMSSQDEQYDKDESTVSPLPDVNFEIEKGHSTNSQESDLEQQEDDQIESSSDNLGAKDTGEDSANIDEENNQPSNQVEHVIDKEESTAAVGFSNETNESPEELDKMLENLESEISIENEPDSESTDGAVATGSADHSSVMESVNIATVDESTDSPSITQSISSTIEETTDVPEVEENLTEVVLAATSDVDIETNENIEDNTEQNPQESNTTNTVEVEAQGSTDLSLSLTEDGNGELRTSLRRTGSTLGSGRRVRFSLNPQYEGENDGEGVSITPESQGLNSEEGTTAAASAEEQAAAPSETSNPLNPEIPAEIQNLGRVAPEWVPDENASNCMKCSMKFTVVKRRHHCRACGKVLCSVCCNMKYCLPYLDYKYVRVCQSCCDIMVSQALSDSPIPPIASSPQPPSTIPAITNTTSASTVPPFSQLPQAPPPYSETVDGHSERLGSASSDVPPYSEHSPSSPQFAEQPAPILPAAVQGVDILPGGGRQPTLTGAQLTEMMNFQLPAYTPTVRQRQNRNRTESEMSAVIMFNSTATNLPPILRRNNEETRIVNNPDLDILFRQVYDENEDPISFIVNKNLVVRVKVYNLDCCVEKKCWCFTSDGMGASNQEEIVILIKCDSYEIDDRTLTRKVLQQMNHIFEKAKHGHPVSDLEQMEFDANMCCMPKNTGMLFFKHSLQCIKKLLIPTSPYLFGMYIERSEQPWAKNFPLRLLLRVGAEYKYYPCPLLNILDRPAVYDGVGRTILELLADFRNYQYTIPRVVGVTINLRGKDTILRLPQHRYDEILKAVNSCEQNVLSLAGNFSSTCDGHLVSVEKDGRYKTQTLSIVLKANRKVTCASFIVVSAALKINQEGIKAKASIVEDGVMVQVTADVMKEFKQAIKDMKEYSVTTGDPNSPDETSSKVGIEWTASDVMDRPRLLSPIDGTSFDNLTNMKIRHSYDYTSNSLTAKIHWVEVYFLPQDNDTVQRLSARELGQMTSSIAKACMSALSAHLMALLALDMTRIGLRVNLAADFVEYKIGANLSTLPAELLPNLDDKLVPAIHAVMSSAQERVAVELIFQVVRIV